MFLVKLQFGADFGWFAELSHSPHLVVWSGRLESVFSALYSQTIIYPFAFYCLHFSRAFYRNGSLRVGLSRDRCYTRFSIFQIWCYFNWVNVRKYVVKLLKLTARWQLNMAAWIMTWAVKPHIAGLFSGVPQTCKASLEQTERDPQTETAQLNDIRLHLLCSPQTESEANKWEHKDETDQRTNDSKCLIYFLNLETSFFLRSSEQDGSFDSDEKVK